MDATGAETRSTRRWIRPLLITAGILLLLIGGVALAGRLVERTRTITETVAAPIARLVVDSDNGRVVVIGSDTEAVTIERAEKYAFRAPRGRSDVEGSDLVVTDGCGGFPIPFVGQCSVDLTVTVPSAVEVEVQTSNGSITIESVAGPVQAETSNGSITVDGTVGTLRLRSSNGRITARDLSTVSADVGTSNGSIDLIFLVPPDQVLGRSSNGDITVAVPGGPFRVETSTSNGDVDLGIATDPAADRVIDLRTSNGDIELRAAATPQG